MPTAPTRPAQRHVDPRRRTALARAAVVLTTSTLLAAACTLPQGDRELRGAAARAAPPATALGEAITDVNRFGTGLTTRLAGAHGDENLVVAPAAVALGLGMVGIGASGDTARELASLVAVDDPAAVATEHNALSQYLAAQTSEQRNAYRKGTVREQATAALWAQTGTQLAPSYLDDLAASYGVGVRLVDFRSDPTSALGALRLRVVEDLPGAPADLVDVAGVDESTKLLSLSSGTISAPWDHPFPAAATAPGSFRTATTGEVQVPMMTLNADTSVRSGTGDGWEAVALPYLGATVELLVVVPTDDLSTLLAGLDADFLASVEDSLHDGQVEVRLPRFGVSSRLPIDPLLDADTPGDAFDATRADLSGMAGEEGLHLDAVAHGAVLHVDEEGSDAVVASVETTPVDIPAPHRIVVDRPFAFVVRDRASGLILLTGWIVDPSRAS